MRYPLLILFLFVMLLPLSLVSQSRTTEFVPEWAKSVVWYQIFPDRFANGDPSNDPTIETLTGADPQEPPQAWQLHPWTSDWFELQPYEQQNGEPELWKHILRRRYGGDLQGIIDKLDYLEELGITALYLNPVFEAPSLHKYDGATYHHIDPNFGPDPVGDRVLMATEVPHDPTTWVWTEADKLALKLIEEAHARGMYIIFDGVFNHMGINSFAFRDVQQNQEASIYKDWFTIHSWDDPEQDTEFDYEGWWGVKSLPELRENENGIVAGPKDYIFAATERWMNPKGMGSDHGIDGWRLDVAFCVGHPFWKSWRQKVKSINPEAYLTAEIVDEPQKVVPYMQGDEFDAEMNYNFAFTCAEFFLYPEEMRCTASTFDKRLAKLRRLYPKGVAEVSQNLFGSHDTNRLSSLIVNRGIGNFRDWGTYFSLSKAAENPKYSPRKPTKVDYHLQKLMVIFQMTYPGAPMVYYGDEVGMWGGNDPDCRKPMVWPDLTYESETHFPDQSLHDPDPVEVETDLLAHYKRLIHIRNQHPALQTGTFHKLLAKDKSRIYAFERTLGTEQVIVVFNLSEEDQWVSLPTSRAPKWDNLLDGKKFKFKARQKGTVGKVKAKWAAILVPQI